jgi:hypothetical protein
MNTILRFLDWITCGEGAYKFAVLWVVGSTVAAFVGSAVLP